MLEWLLTPIDPARLHEISTAVSWHGRVMMLAWGILVPLAVLMARYGKVLPSQNWPQSLDNPTWWRVHWITNSIVFVMSLVGFALVFQGAEGPAGIGHQSLGYALLFLLVLQVGGGLLRGSKGGPTAVAADGSWHGDHYDMTKRRRVFETIHKAAGYLALALAILTLLTGLWHVNAPIWMFAVLILWWMFLAIAVVWLQRMGYALDTYQAIWGPDQSHPGNTMKPIGLGIRQIQEEHKHVR